jgi:hypothetical protein
MAVLCDIAGDGWATGFLDALAVDPGILPRCAGFTRSPG